MLSTKLFKAGVDLIYTPMEKNQIDAFWKYLVFLDFNIM